MSISSPLPPQPPEVPDPNFGPRFDTLVEQIQDASGAVFRPTALENRPLYGQTLFIASCALDTRFGSFRAYVFQDIIDKHYIIALSPRRCGGGEDALYATSLVLRHQ
jgi:3,4-dihydroxy 2-butanone 4-phosphate synthase/GTP cyclohydrolase II